MRLAESLNSPAAIVGFAVLGAGTLLALAIAVVRSRRTSHTAPDGLTLALLLAGFLGGALLAITIPFWVLARGIQIELSEIRKESQAAAQVVGNTSRFTYFTMGLTDRLYEMQAEQITRAILSLQRYREPRRLSPFEAKIYSEGGEDGIIAEVFRRIGVTNRFFVDFGSSDGQQNNSVFLLRSGWSGVWIDGNPTAIAAAKRNFAADISAGRLNVIEAFITAENIEELFSRAKVPAEFDLLSIDIDRNDYWVWRKIEQSRPRAVVIEYNAMFPPGVEWVVGYDANAWSDGTSHFGASLRSYELLGRKKKGYSLWVATLRVSTLSSCATTWRGIVFIVPIPRRTTTSQSAMSWLTASRATYGGHSVKLQHLEIVAN